MTGKSWHWRIVLALATLSTLVLVVFPVYILFKYSFSDRASIVTGGEVIPWWPYSPTLEMYRFLFSASDFLRANLMSAEVALLAVAISLILGAPAAYALARYRVPAKGVLLLSLLSVRLFPDVAAVVPVAEIFFRLNLQNSVLGVALAHTLLAMPYVLFIAMGVFEAIPRDLDEQALVLGAGKLGAFFKVSLPLAGPGLAAAAIYAFLLSWDEFIFAYFLLFFSDTFTLPVYLQKILSWSPQQNLLAAVSVILSLPVILFTLAVQRYMRLGILSGALK
jgi:multiple sugar transport system permease protein